MKIAVCSLSTFTYVAEAVDLAVELSAEHDVRYLLGFRDPASVALLERCGLAYDVLLDAPPALVSPAEAASTHDVFRGFFFAQAAAVLPALTTRLRAWGADIVLSHLRDFAGINAADHRGIPVVSFGSHANPVRDAAVDPPFGSGLGRAASPARRRLLWQYGETFHASLDDEYNRTLRAPLGLSPVRHASTHVSDRLVLLSLIPSLGGTNGPTPAHVRYVGSLFTSRASATSPAELALLAMIAASPAPRVFLSLGTTYGTALLPRCLEALAGFEGTIVASGTGDARADGVIAAPFFDDVHAVLERCDAVVTVCGGKTVTHALAHGLPMVGLPRQGEQKDIAVALHERGAALLPCLRGWDGAAFREAVDMVCREPQYRVAAHGMHRELVSCGGAARAAEEVVRVVATH